jgi:hypothetical protein
MISLFLCACLLQAGLCASARKIIVTLPALLRDRPQRRKDAKSIEGGQEPAPKDFRGIFSLVLCLHKTGRNDLTIPLRLPAAGRPLRLCAKKKVTLPALLRDRPQRHKDAKGLLMVGLLAAVECLFLFIRLLKWTNDLLPYFGKAFIPTPDFLF